MLRRLGLLGTLLLGLLSAQAAAKDKKGPSVEITAFDRPPLNTVLKPLNSEAP